MTPALLSEIGQALHGTDWRTPLAADLGRSRKTIQRWEAGEFAIPDDVEAQAVELLRAHGIAITGLLRRLGTRKAA